MKMKKIINICVWLMAMTTFSACEEKNDSLLLTSTTQLTFDADGGSQTFDIESNTDWTITSSAEWLTVSPSSGNLNQSVNVTVAVTDNQLEEESKLVIHTNDGEKVVNINVKVEGSYVKSGKHLDIRNHSTRLFLGGKAGVVDSLRIRANIAWEIKGPDWIEAWDGERWRPLSQERAVIKGKGSNNVYIRTASNNREEDDLEDLITVSEQFTGDYNYSINVEQLGRLHAMPWNVETLANGVAFEWICGCDVEKIYFRVSEKEEKDAMLDDVRQTFDVTYPDYIHSIEGMKEHSSRVVESQCEDRHGELGRYRSWHTLNSAKGEERCLSIVTDIKEESGNLWRIYVKSDVETEKLWAYVSNNPNGAFAYTTPILYHIFMKNLIYVSGYYKVGGKYFEWNMNTSSNERHVFIQSKGISGKSSNYVSRYDRYYDANGNELPAKSLLDRIPKSMVTDPSLR